MRSKREAKIIPKDDIIFQITSWYASDIEYDVDEDDEDSRLDKTKYLIKIFGVTQEGISVSCNLIDFPPFFYIKSPIPITDNYQIRQLKEFIIQKLPTVQKNNLVEVKLMKKKDFWGFTNNKDFTFVRLSFKNHACFKIASNIFRRKQFVFNKELYFKLYENNIDPFLRFAHIKNINPAGWVKIPAKNYYQNNDINPTRCQIDITCRWSVIESYHIEKIAPLVIASFDLECTSSHGDFPVASKNYKKVANELIQLNLQSKEELVEQITLSFDHSVPGKLSKVFPKTNKDPFVHLKRYTDDIFSILQGRMNIKTSDSNQPMTKDTMIKLLSDQLSKCLPALEGDPIIQIGTTVHIYGEKECSYNHIITLGSCDPIPDIIIEQCATERELLLAWRNLIVSLDPDVLIGYNIFGFDMPYLYERAVENNIKDIFCEIGKIKNTISPYVEKQLSSSALGDNLLRFISMEGRVLIDIMKVVQRDHKLDSYKLDTVSSTFLGGKVLSINQNICKLDNTKGISLNSFIKFDSDVDNKFKIINIDDTTITLDQNISQTTTKWGLAKDDITPRQIFECQNGTSEDRALVAKYCIKDCSLCNYLLMKLETLANNIGMANVCSVPLDYIFMRGQGIKIFSLVAKQCRQDDFLIPCLTKNQKDLEEDEDQDGYEGAIVLEPKEGIYLDMPISVLDYASLYPSSMISENLSHDCIVLDQKYDNLEGFEYLDISYDIYEKQGDKKVKKGIKTCRFVQLPEKGVIPRILMNLLKQRKATRKKIEFKTVITENNTYTGLLKDNKITLEDNSIIILDNIKSITDTYDDFQKAVLDGLQSAYKVTANSLYGQCGAKTSQIYMKDIAACTTATGRKMIMMAKEFIESKVTKYKLDYEPDVVYGDSVTGDTPLIIKYPDGHINIHTIDSITQIWEPYDNFKIFDKGLSEKEQSYINAEIWADGKWAKINRIIRHKTDKKIYRVNTLAGSIDVTEDHSLININKHKIKPKEVIVGQTQLLHSFPIYNYSNSDISNLEAFKQGVNQKVCPKILNASDNLKLWFLKGYLLVNNKLIFKTKINAQKIYYIFRSLGYVNIGIQTYNNNYKIIIITPTNTVTSVTQLPEETKYVYDIETTSGIFHGGVGAINISNTDSLFIGVKFKDSKGEPIIGKEAIPFARELGIQISKEFKKLIKHPHDLEWEKLFYPFILFSKKRYCANKYEYDDHKYKFASMGIALKRRDNAHIVKTIYGGVIDIILNQHNLRKSITFLQENLQFLINGQIPLEELIITKSLKSDYKDPTRIAHKTLAERIGERDPGNKPQVNDRIPYVYVQIPITKKKVLQGERIEHPDYIIENNLKPDYEFYITNQIMTPVLQIYALVLEQLDGYKPNTDYKALKQKLLKEKDDVKKAKDKWNDLREAEVKKLLFDPILIKLQNKRAGNRPITDFFTATTS
jgi:DNA polymerase elongation subunit (family B)